MTTRELKVEQELLIQKLEGGVWFVGDEMCATTISAGEKIAKALGLNGEITAACKPPRKRPGRKPKSVLAPE